MANSPVVPLAVPASPGVAVLTVAQKQTKLLNELNTDSGNLFRAMVQAFNRGYANIWTNPEGLTPQQACDALGVGATEAFRRAGILATAINAAVPNTVPATTPKTVTPNADGTVTVGA